MPLVFVAMRLHDCMPASAESLAIAAGATEFARQCATSSARAACGVSSATNMHITCERVIIQAPAGSRRVRAKREVELVAAMPLAQGFGGTARLLQGGDSTQHSAGEPVAARRWGTSRA